MTAQPTLVLPVCSFFDDRSMKPSQGSSRPGNCGIGQTLVAPSHRPESYPGRLHDQPLQVTGKNGANERI